jgi:hypothetical protein
MTNDSGLFRTRGQLEGEGFRLEGNVFVRGAERWLPLYEAKMVHQFDHRFGDYSMQPAGSKDTQLPEVPLDRLADPDYLVLPRYWVPESRGRVAAQSQGLGPRLAAGVARYHERNERAHGDRGRDPTGGGGQ